MAEVNCQASDRLDYGDGDCINANPTWAFPRLTGMLLIRLQLQLEANIFQAPLQSSRTLSEMRSLQQAKQPPSSHLGAIRWSISLGIPG